MSPLIKKLQLIDLLQNWPLLIEIHTFSVSLCSLVYLVYLVFVWCRDISGISQDVEAREMNLQFVMSF